MFAARFAFVLSAFAAACTSSSSEPPRPAAELAELVVSASCTRHEDTEMLAIAVANRGRGPAAPTAARIEFEGDPASSIVRRTRFIAAHAVDSFEVELPALCSKIACRWHITVDAAHETGRC